MGKSFLLLWGLLWLGGNIFIQGTTVSETEGNPGTSESISGSEASTESEAVPEKESEAEVEGEPNSETVSKSESEAESESEPQPENEPESEAAPESESEEGSSKGVNPFLILYSLCILFILVGNITIAVLIVKNKELRTNTSNLYLLSLVTARASIGIFVVPARITGMFSERYIGTILCKLCHLAALGSGAASVFSIVAIALIKYLQVINPEKVTKLSMKKATAIIIVVWLFGFLYAIREPIINDLIQVDTGSGLVWSCTMSPVYSFTSKYLVFADCIFLFLGPFVIITYCYTKVIRKLTQRSLATPGSKKATVDKNATKAIQMLLTLMILFTICTGAPIVLKIYILWGGGYFPSIKTVEATVYWFSYSNAWFNIVVFAVFRDDLRKAFLELGCIKRCRKKNCVQPDSPAQELPRKIDSIPDNSVNVEQPENMMQMEF